MISLTNNARHLKGSGESRNIFEDSHLRCNVCLQEDVSLQVDRTKTGAGFRKSLAVYFLMVYSGMLVSLHLLRRVCKAASEALWTLMQGSCRRAWSPEMKN